MDRSEQEGRAAHPVGEGRAIELDPLLGIDPSLAVERQVIGVLAHRHMGDGRLGGDAALDQPSRRKGLAVEATKVVHAGAF